MILKSIVKHFFVYAFITIISFYALFAKIFDDPNVLVYIKNERPIYKDTPNVREALEMRMLLSLGKYFNLEPSDNLINEYIIKRSPEFFDKENKVDLDLFKKTYKFDTMFFKAQKSRISMDFLTRTLKVNDNLKGNYIDDIINSYLYDIREYVYIKISFNEMADISDEKIMNIYNSKKFFKMDHYKVKYLVAEFDLYPMIRSEIKLGATISEIAEKYKLSVLEKDIESASDILKGKIEIVDNNNNLEVIYYENYLPKREKTFAEAYNEIKVKYVSENKSQIYEKLKILENKTYDQFFILANNLKYELNDFIYEGEESLAKLQVMRENKADILSLNLNISSEIFSDESNFYVFILKNYKYRDLLKNSTMYRPVVLKSLLDFMMLEKEVRFTN